MKLKTLSIKTHDGICFLTLNRPENFNSIDFQFCDDLVVALEACDKDHKTKAVIITGTGKAFCAGGDLSMTKEYLNSDPSEPYRQLIKGLNRVIIEIRQLNKPVIAAINGSIAGAGISLAAACDLRIAAKSAKFKQAYTSIGLTPDGAWMLFVPLLIGFGKANELLYLDPTFNADQALEMGLINEVIGDEQLESRATEIAVKIANGSRHSNAIVKDLMNQSMFTSLERQLELERQGIITASSTKDYAEGISAFFEKRMPKFE